MFASCSTPAMLCPGVCRGPHCCTGRLLPAPSNCHPAPAPAPQLVGRYDNCEMRSVVLVSADAPPRPDPWHFAGGDHARAPL